MFSEKLRPAIGNEAWTWNGKVSEALQLWANPFNAGRRQHLKLRSLEE